MSRFTVWGLSVLASCAAVAFGADSTYPLTVGVVAGTVLFVHYWSNL